MHALTHMATARAAAVTRQNIARRQVELESEIKEAFRALQAQLAQRQNELMVCPELTSDPPPVLELFLVFPSLYPFNPCFGYR